MKKQTPLKSVVVVTGGSHGIGRAAVQLFSEQGYRVFNFDLLEGKKSSGEAEFIKCDVTDEKQVSLCLNRVYKLEGRLDCLVNNAGINMEGDVVSLSTQDWERCMNTNLKAAFLTSRASIPMMKKNPLGGSIINVSSNAGLRTRMMDPVYAVSKEALNSFTKALALTLASHRIRVNAVCPGPVQNTELMNKSLEKSKNPKKKALEIIEKSPLAKAWGRMIYPEEVAALIVYLAGENARMISGSLIAIDGAKSIA